MPKKLRRENLLKGLRLPLALEPVTKLIEFANAIGTDERARELAALDLRDRRLAEAMSAGNFELVRAAFEAATQKRRAFYDATLKEARRILRPQKMPSGETILWLDCPPQHDKQSRAIPIHGDTFEIARRLRTAFRTAAQQLAEAEKEASGTADERRARKWWAGHPVVTIPSGSFAPSLRDIHMQVYDDGRLHLTTDLLYHCVIAALERLEAWRLRICPACDRLYLAKASNSIACSARCGDTVYMRRYRRDSRRKKKIRRGDRYEPSF